MNRARTGCVARLVSQKRESVVSLPTAASSQKRESVVSLPTAAGPRCWAPTGALGALLLFAQYVPGTKIIISRRPGHVRIC